MRTSNSIKCITIVLLFCVLLAAFCFIIVPKQNSAFAANEIDVNIAHSDENAPLMQAQASERWYTEVYRINYSPNDDYSDLTPAAKYPDYLKPAGGIVAAGIPLNDEMFAVTGIDSQNTQRLMPVSDFGSVNNITAVNHAVMEFTFVRQFPEAYNCSFSDDSRKMKDLFPTLRMPGDSTKVGKGKIMWRTAPIGGYYSDWQYVNLTTSPVVRFEFTGRQAVQMAIFYEIREEADHLFHPHLYHHIVGIYRFDIV